MVRNAAFVESALQGNVVGKKAQHGFDLSLKEVKVFRGTGRVSKNKTDVPEYVSLKPDENGYFNLEKGVYSITFNEGVAIPKNHCAWIKTRSSLVRNGSIIDSGLYDTAFCVEEAGAVLFVSNFIAIEKDARVAQLLLFEAEDTVAYDGQWQKNKDRK